MQHNDSEKKIPQAELWHRNYQEAERECGELQIEIGQLREQLKSCKRMYHELTDAVYRGGYEIAPCDMCDAPIICLDSGVGGLCSKCAEKMEKEQ